MAHQELTHAEKVEKAKKLLSNFRTGMLITSTLDGRPHARPMSIAEVDAKGTISFVTALASPKVGEILHHPGVVVTMQSETAFVSASGEARIITDLEEKRRVWELGAEIWFDGPEDPEAALIRLTPETVEYWDRRGMNSVRFLLEAVRAVAGGDSPKEDDARVHARVHL